MNRRRFLSAPLALVSVPAVLALPAPLSAREKFLRDVAALMDGRHRVFEIGRAGALAQAAYKGHLAVWDAWEAGMSVGSPWSPHVAAWYARQAGERALALMNRIRNQQFPGSR